MPSDNKKYQGHYMTTPHLVPPEFVNMKSHNGITEKWLEERLIENPRLLGLGDLVVVSSQIPLSSGGILDLQLRNDDDTVRYEVELQLGAVDPSHIIRTIEYWDLERRRSPQHEHIAVIVAEDITSRFFNVISLFNRAIPLIAIQIKGVTVNSAFTLVATRVLDLSESDADEQSQREPADRGYWERTVPDASLKIVDRLLDLACEVENGVSLNYTKSYVNLVVDGRVRNFLQIHPQKRNVRAGFKIPQNDDSETQIRDAGLSFLGYSTHFGGHYRINVTDEDLNERREALLLLMKQARDTMLG